MSSDTVHNNVYTHGALGPILAKTALPIIFVMATNGLLTVVDAVFLGVFVGADALGAVTLMFPASMLIIALSTLVSNGMSSLLARALGGNQIDKARAVFAGSHGLALLVSLCLICLFFVVGRPLTLLAANNVTSLANMGHTYLLISIVFSPLFFVLAINSDALRNEGKVGFMAAMSLLVSVANIGFNFFLIVVMDLGVAGSALGTACAQILALCIILTFRLSKNTSLRLTALKDHSLLTEWPSILALGAPQSLNFLGIALISAATIAALQWVSAPNYEATIAAFGIMTRIMTFVFLPLLGLSFALQSMIGNNYGAELWQRSDKTLRLGLITAFAYCALTQVLLIWNAERVGLIFVDDLAVVREVQRIMPVMVAMLFATGPLMIVATYFQAIGDARRAGLLSLAKPYAFSLPLVFFLPIILGEPGIWLAGPLAELLLAILTVVVLSETARKHSLSWGLFKSPLPQSP